MYCYLKCIVYDKLLKLRQSFLITLYISAVSRYTDCAIPSHHVGNNVK